MLTDRFFEEARPSYSGQRVYLERAIYPKYSRIMVESSTAQLPLLQLGHSIAALSVGKPSRRLVIALLIPMMTCCKSLIRIRYYPSCHSSSQPHRCSQVDA